MTKRQFNIPQAPFIAFVHTIQIGCKYEMIPEDEANAKPYISKSVKYSDGKVHYVINPNNFNPECNYITNIDEYEQTYAAIINDLGLSDQIVFLERADITIDIDASYDQFYKLNCFLKRLYALSISEKNSYQVIGDNLKRRSTVVNNRNCSLEIYNKRDESGKPNVPEIRVEFRRKRIRKSATIHDIVNQVSDLLLNLPLLIHSFNSVQTEILIDAYKQECQSDREGRTRNINDFVMKYADNIYSRNHLFSFYGSVKSGDFKSWFHRYKKSGRVLTLINDRTLKEYCRRLSLALKQYAKK